MVDVILPSKLKQRKEAEAKIKAANHRLAERKKNAAADFEKWEVEAAKKIGDQPKEPDRKSTRLNSSHALISYAVFCLKKKKKNKNKQKQKEWKIKKNK